MRRFVGVLLLTFVVTTTASPADGPCGRQCLYGYLDQYLSALKDRDPSRVPWAKTVRNTENNVALPVGDGVWGTALGLGAYDVRFADAKTGSVGFYGVMKEAEADSPFALRLKISHGRIAEAEMLISRLSDSGVPFVRVPDSADSQQTPSPEPSARVSRDAMIALANGYFDTFQKNNGELRTTFDDGCNRIEDGTQTTNNPGVPYAAFMALGCTEQFRLGYFRYVDRLRSRRFLVADEERGIVMTGSLFDLSGRLVEYALTDGRKVPSLVRRPVSYCMLETFTIRGGKIAHIEAIFVKVPYGMPSPWVGAGFHYE
jgi:hypothetical protein